MISFLPIYNVQTTLPAFSLSSRYCYKMWCLLSAPKHTITSANLIEILPPGLIYPTKRPEVKQIFLLLFVVEAEISWNLELGRSSCVAAIHACEPIGPVEERTLERDRLHLALISSVSDDPSFGNLVNPGQGTGNDNHLLFGAAESNAAAFLVLQKAFIVIVDNVENDKMSFVTVRGIDSA